MKNAEQKFRFALFLYKCIVILLASMCVFALASCAPISTGGGYSSDGGGAIGSGGDSSGSGGSGGRNGVPITISLPAIGSASIRALTEEQRTRLQSETAKYRVTFSGAGQMITREGTGTIYSATFPVGTQVGVTVYCVNAAGQDIVRTTTKTITVSSGANSLSFQISADGTELEHVPDNPPSPQPEPGPTPTPTPQPTPGIQYVTVRFHQGWVRSSAAGTAVTWGAMTGAVLPTDGRRVYGSSTSADQASAQGYVFIGWTADSTQPTGTVQFREYYSPGPDDVSLDLYGIWEVRESENHYRVIFNSGNTPGSTVSNLPQNFQQEKDTQATIPTSPNNPLSCPGYVFKGWSASPNVQWQVKDVGISDTFTMPESDVTLTAQWDLITYTIQYASSGQLSDLKYGTSFDVANGGSTVEMADANTFTKKGYTLSWWTSPNSQFSVYQPGDNSVSKIGIIECADGASNDPTKVTITLVADWEAIQYTITYDANGGGNNPNDTTFRIDQDDIEFPDGNDVLNNPGHIFVCWETASGTDVTNITTPSNLIDLMPRGSTTLALRARWEETVTFYVISHYYNLKSSGVIDDQSGYDPDPVEYTEKTGARLDDSTAGCYAWYMMSSPMYGLMEKDGNNTAVTGPLVTTVSRDMEGKTYYRTYYDPDGQVTIKQFVIDKYYIYDGNIYEEREGSVGMGSHNNYSILEINEGGSLPEGSLWQSTYIGWITEALLQSGQSDSHSKTAISSFHNQIVYAVFTTP